MAYALRQSVRIYESHPSTVCRVHTCVRCQSKVESAVSTPLVSRDEVVGVLNVNAGAERTFTEYDLRAMSVFAEQAAAAISNAPSEQKRCSS